MPIKTILPVKLMPNDANVQAFGSILKAARKVVMLDRFPVTAARRLCSAAVALTVQIAIDYGYDATQLRAMERDLIDRLEGDE